MSLSIQPVSYTHLDVYKRQGIHSKFVIFENYNTGPQKSLVNIRMNNITLHFCYIPLLYGMDRAKQVLSFNSTVWHLSVCLFGVSHDNFWIHKSIFVKLSKCVHTLTILLHYIGFEVKLKAVEGSLLERGPNFKIMSEALVGY